MYSSTSYQYSFEFVSRWNPKIHLVIWMNRYKYKKYTQKQKLLIDFLGLEVWSLSGTIYWKNNHSVRFCIKHLFHKTPWFTSLKIKKYLAIININFLYVSYLNKNLRNVVEILCVLCVYNLHSPKKVIVQWFQSSPSSK